MAALNDIDLDTDEEDNGTKEGQNNTQLINTAITKQKEIDIDDEAVKDRWSRYIGAMGVEAAVPTPRRPLVRVLTVLHG